MMSDKNKTEILLDGKAIEISGMGDLFTENGSTTSENEIQLTNSIRSLCKNEYLSALTVVDSFCNFSEKMHSFEQHIYQESKRLRSKNIEQKITDFIQRYEAWKIENQK